MTRKQTKISAIIRTLTYTLIFAVCAAPAMHAQQQSTPQRERRVTQTPQQPTPQATPQTTPTPNVSPTPNVTSTPSVAAPSPITNVAPFVRRIAPQSIAELAARLTEIVRRPAFAAAQTGVKVVSLDSGRTLFEDNAGKLLLPASNMKLYTTAAALVRLTPDFRFTTSAYAVSRPDATGTLRGDLIIFGRGDPTFAARFNNGNTFAAIDDFAARIAASGVRRIEGDIIGDESFFNGAPLGAGWEWDDLQWYYGAEISALSVNDNAIDLTVRPATQVGDASVVTTGATTSTLVAVLNNNSQVNNPPSVHLQSANGYQVSPNATSTTNNTTSTTNTTNVFSSTTNAAATPNQVSSNQIASNPNLSNTPYVTVINNATTGASGERRDFSVYRPLNSNTIILSGTLPQGGANFSGSVAVANPALMFTHLLRQSLVRRGVIVTGKTQIVDARARRDTPLPPALIELAVRHSPPLSVIAAQTLKPSQNLYTELILRALGKATNSDPQLTSAEAGIAAVQSLLREAGVDARSVVNVDGSGLSRGDYVTADATVRLLAFMDKQLPAIRTAFYDAQPIAGVDGTLRNRMKGTPAAGNVRAKTGTLSNATSLSGYVTTAAGERLAFALMINNCPADLDPRTEFTDPVAVLLASLTARSSTTASQ